MSSSQDDFTHASDTELVKLAKAGNAEAFTLLFQRYKRPVRGYLTGLVGNSEDADDLTQQAFLNAWDKLLTLHDEDRFKSWIFTIARNLAYDYRRLQVRSPSQSLESLKEREGFRERNDAVDAINLEDETVVKELVKLALAELPPKYRDCLLLFIKGEFSRDEIAELLKISKASVSTYICTARKLFRQAYYRLKNEVDDTEKGDQLQ
jgi:RNA polymerase sigma-70 factor, ECF subfamily